MASFDKLKGINDISESTLSDNLESNLITFFNWGLLGIGAFGNVVINNASGAYGGDMSFLSPVRDRNYQEGQVWQAFRQDWVWESGINYSVQPIQVSGVYVNGTFHSLASTGTFAHHVNYVLGRIVFDSPISMTSNVVQAEYSYRLFPFQSSNQTWFRNVQFESFRVDDTQFQQYGSGIWDVLAQDRVQLPTVVVEITPRSSMFGYELGGTTTINKDILYHVFAENPWDRQRMLDIIAYQKDKTLPLFDKNLMAAASKFPLDYRGAIASGAMCFPDLVKPTGQGGFYWRAGTFVEMTTMETISQPPLYQGCVRSSFGVNILLI